MLKLRVLVDAARSRLAELESVYTVEKARVDSLQARLFRLLRTRCQERDRLRLVVRFREQFLEVLQRHGHEQPEQVAQKFRQAETCSEQEYEDMAQTLEARRELTADEQSELRTLWRKLVSLYHPDRFAHEPDKLATYEKLTAAINNAKDRGNIETLRQIADDPHGFIVRQGWASLDFRDEEQAKRLEQLYCSLMAEISKVLLARERLHHTPEFELYELTAEKPGVLEDVVETQKKSLEAEITELAYEADRLADEIAKLTVKPPPGRHSGYAAKYS